jgi:hypothetical protein
VWPGATSEHFWIAPTRRSLATAIRLDVLDSLMMNPMHFFRMSSGAWQSPWRRPAARTLMFWAASMLYLSVERGGVVGYEICLW